VQLSCSKLAAVQDLDTYLNKLRQSGYRNSQLRFCLLDLFLNISTTLTVTELLNSPSIRKFQPNKTTIYREIETLIKENILEEISAFGSAKAYKISQQGHHHHLICRNCNKTDCIESDSFESYLLGNIKEIEKENNFKVKEHEVVFYGICADCEVTK
jgi:Fur family transcriptional regulator, ferric uptake regulator